MTREEGPEENQLVKELQESVSEGEETRPAAPRDNEPIDVACPQCNTRLLRLEMFWSKIITNKLQLRHRKRCKRCKIRWPVKIYGNEQGGLSIVVIFDDFKVIKGMAELHGISYKEARDGLLAAMAEAQEAPFEENAELVDELGNSIKDAIDEDLSCLEDARKEIEELSSLDEGREEV